MLTDRMTIVSGKVMDPRGQAVKDYVVALYPRDLKENTIATRFIQSARPDQEGRYQASGLPPGNYFAVAIGTMLQGRQWDPAFQEQMRPRAKSFSLKEGETLILDLPLETAP